MGDIEHSDEWTTMQAALAFGGFTDAAETERVTLWAAEEIESLRRQLGGAVEDRDRLLALLAKHGLRDAGDSLVYAKPCAATRRNLGGR